MVDVLMVEVCVEFEVIKVLSDYFLMDRKKIGCQSRLVEDLNVDSVDIVEIIILMDEVFDVELISGRIERWSTVGDIVDSVLEVYM
ncbi:acyl carrier protein [Pseudomonas sp. NFACC37-1]|uniref:acyl carrier protein n=1 Tax=Pseudomonas sp. NFACC37-1 TaxID=1566196 RepID=UPI000B80766A|nr:phosphopantetheine-binding protein [Pseudomonas sp. NFACC37-1]